MASSAAGAIRGDDKITAAMSALEMPDGPWIVGHRGAAGEELENTLASVERALAAGVVMIEVDLQLTADGRLVVFHDETLERLAGDRRRVASLSAAQVARLRLRAPGRRGTHRIPRLEELLAAVPETTALNLEAKTRRQRAAPFARRLLGDLGGRRRILVSSFDWSVLAVLRRLAPDLPLAPISRDDRGGLLAAGAELGAYSLHCHHRLADRRLLAAARTAGRPVLAYTVDQPRRARTLLRRGVRGVFTDRPAAMRRALERWPA